MAKTSLFSGATTTGLAGTWVTVASGDVATAVVEIDGQATVQPIYRETSSDDTHDLGEPFVNSTVQNFQATGELSFRIDEIGDSASVTVSLNV